MIIIIIIHLSTIYIYISSCKIKSFYGRVLLIPSAAQHRYCAESVRLVLHETVSKWNPSKLGTDRPCVSLKTAGTVANGTASRTPQWIHLERKLHLELFPLRSHRNGRNSSEWNRIGNKGEKVQIESLLR